MQQALTNQRVSGCALTLTSANGWPASKNQSELKIGGVMALDDVLLNDETKEANNAFIESVKEKSIIIDNGYQIWLRKTTE